MNSKPKVLIYDKSSYFFSFFSKKKSCVEFILYQENKFSSYLSMNFAATIFIMADPANLLLFQSINMIKTPILLSFCKSEYYIQNFDLVNLENVKLLDIFTTKRETLNVIDEFLLKNISMEI